MLTYTYYGKEDFRLTDKPVPQLKSETDALVKVTLSSGEVVAVGKGVRKVQPGDRVSINVETFCGECWFCKRGYVNNCLSPFGGWAMGCRIDGMQAEYVRVPFADTETSKRFWQAIFWLRDIGRQKSPK